MGSPAIFKGSRTGLLSSRGLLLKDGTTIDNDGLVNFIKNSSGFTNTNGWVEGSYAAASRPSGTFTASSGAGAFAISTTTTNPLGAGTTSFLLTKSSGANRQGRAIETSFALPLSYRAKVLQINIDYIIDSGSFVAGIPTADSSLIWYCAFSTDNGSTYTTAEPSAFKLLSNSTTVSDKFAASIQTPSNATNMKLIAYVAESANSAWAVKCIVSVNPSNYVYGTPFTDPQNYTTVVTGLGTATVNLARWWREGAFMCGEVRVTAGTATASSVTFTLPAGYAVDYSLTSYAGAGNSSSTAHPDLSLIWDNTGGTNLISVANTQSGTSGFTVLAGTSLGTGSVNSFQFRVKILGWSASAQMSDGYDGRTVSLTTRKTSTQTIATGTATSVTGFATPAIMDNLAGFNASTGTYRFFKPGRYTITGAVSWGGSSTGFRVLALLKNGSTELASKYIIPSNAAEFNMDISYQDDFVAGDTLNLRVFQNSGGNLNITNSTTGTGTAQFCINSVPGVPTISANETVAARYTDTSGQILPNGPTILNFTTLDYDTHGIISGNVATVPISGIYEIRGLFRGQVNNGATATMRLYAFRSGIISYLLGELFPAASGNQFYTVEGSVRIRLRAGETVALRLQTTFASNITASTTAEENSFEIIKVGN